MYFSLGEDAMWNIKIQFYGYDNLERTMCGSDITYVNLLAVMEAQGFG